METELLRLTKELIALKTVPEVPADLASALLIIERELQRFTIERFESNGWHSILVHNQKERPERFRLLLNCHLDVIPGKDEQYTARIEGDRLYGVGAMDMKGNLVSALLAFKSVAATVQYPVAIQFVTDEETGGFFGTKYQVDSGVRADFVLATEPTNFDIVHEAKGVLWLEVTAPGLTAHGAYPWRGQNAILRMHSFLTELTNLIQNPGEQAWQTTLNVATVSSTNTAYNKIPDECTVGLDIRFVPADAEVILEKVKALIPEDFTLTVKADEPALNTESQNPFVTVLSQVTEGEIKKAVVLRSAQGSSDARHFTRVGCAGIEFGPVGEGIGSDNEWVSIESLEQYQHILEAYMKALESSIV